MSGSNRFASREFPFIMCGWNGVIDIGGPGGSLVLRPDEVEAEDVAKTKRVPLDGIPVP